MPTVGLRVKTPASPANRVAWQLAASLGPDLSRELRRIARKATSADLEGAVLIRLPQGQRRWVEFHSSRTNASRIRIELRSVEDRDAPSIRAATELADGVGSIRESVARSLGLFRRRGWIATTAMGPMSTTSSKIGSHEGNRACVGQLGTQARAAST